MWTPPPRANRSALTSFTVFAAITLILSLINFPLDSLARHLVDRTQIGKDLHWDSFIFSPGQGIRVHQIQVNFPQGPQLRIPRAFVRLQWLPLLAGRIQIHHLEADTVFLKGTPHPSTTVLPITEETLGELLILTQSLDPIVSSRAFQIHASSIEFLQGNQSVHIGAFKGTCAPCGMKAGWQFQMGQLALPSFPLIAPAKIRLRTTDELLMPITAQLGIAGGRVDIAGDMDVDSRAGLSKLRIELSRLNAGDILGKALPTPSRLEAKVNGNLEWEGRLGNYNTWRGSGRLEMADLLVSDWSFQRDGELRRFAPGYDTLEFSGLILDSISIRGPVLQSAFWQLKSRQITAQGRGQWTLPDQMEFHIRGQLAWDRVKELPELTQLALAAKPEHPGEFEAVLVGTLPRQKLQPSAKHVRKAVDGQFRKIGQGIRRLFGN